MLVKTKKKVTKPCAWIVSSNDKGRKSIKNGKVFLNDGDEFEIELFNPLTVSVLADIKLNNQSISKTGLVIRPGQRVYLDCFIDDRRKFKFSTYEIENTEESLDATQNNGLLEVFFYKEDVITLDNWQRKFDRIIIEKQYPYNPNPWYNPYTINKHEIYYTSNNCNYSTNVNLTNCLGTSNITPISTVETGRVEKGSSSSQKFNEVDMEFENNYISSTIIQILPESRKPIEKKDLNKNIKDLKEADNIIDLIKKLADLHSAGILTDEEFSAKKVELLSKI